MKVPKREARILGTALCKTGAALLSRVGDQIQHSDSKPAVTVCAVGMPCVPVFADDPDRGRVVMFAVNADLPHTDQFLLLTSEEVLQAGLAVLKEHGKSALVLDALGQRKGTTH